MFLGVNNDIVVHEKKDTSEMIWHLRLILELSSSMVGRFVGEGINIKQNSCMFLVVKLGNDT